MLLKNAIKKLEKAGYAVENKVDNKNIWIACHAEYAPIKLLVSSKSDQVGISIGIIDFLSIQKALTHSKQSGRMGYTYR